MTSLPKSLEPKTLATLDGLQIRSRQVVEGLLAGTHRSPFRGVSVEFAEHREYVPGDDLRHVDWKVYGRTDKLYLKRFVEETNLNCVLLVDNSTSMQYKSEGGLTKYEYAQCIAAALGWVVLRNGDTVGAAVGSDAVQRWLESASHPQQFERLVDVLETPSAELDSAMSSVQSFSSFLLESASRIPQRSVVFILSDFLLEADEIVQGVERLRVEGHDVSVFQLLDRDELEFPFTGDMQFKALEGQQQVRVNAEVISGRFQELIEEFCNTLEARVRNLGADYELLVTDVNLQAALLTYFQRIQAKRTS